MFGYDEFQEYVAQYSVDELREDLDRIVNFFRDQPYHQHAMELFIRDFRELPLSIADEAKAFVVDEEMTLSELPDWMFSEPLGFVKNKTIPMSGRCVFPVMDIYGHAMGFCGWDPFETPKYLDSRNYGYRAKITTLYGMEKMSEYYNSKKPVFVTEGLMCTLYLRSQGFQALSSLGSWLTKYVITILSRFGNRLVMVPDNDETGDKFVKQIKYSLPNAMIIQCMYGKDIEGFRKLEDHKYEAQLLDDLKNIENPFATTKLLIRR